MRGHRADTVITFRHTHEHSRAACRRDWHRTRREHTTASNRSETALGKQNPTRRKEHFSTRASPLPRPDLIASAGTDSFNRTQLPTASLSLPLKQ
ncbi:hypothetical protein SFRURICE_018407 [Spodoptera frugiperda]|nr:hypothetical protein SFRURICE_018407 [Spodoptera frugiperda]